MKRLFAILTLALITLILNPQYASAHCDGIDGPVVKAAQRALETENVNLVLIWVQKDDEETIRRVFEHSQKVRKLGEDAQKLADRFFFETLVRIHRAGEGAPFTGLKPAGRDLGPAIPAADNAIESGSAKDLLDLLTDEVHNGLHERFVKVKELKNYDPNNVAGGQEYVKAYVDFVHYAEGIYGASQKSGHTSAENESETTSGHAH